MKLHGNPADAVMNAGASDDGWMAKLCLIGLLLLTLITTPEAFAKDLEFQAPVDGEAAALDRSLGDLARRFLSVHSREEQSANARDLFWVQLAAGRYADAEANVRSLRDDASLAPFEMYAMAKRRESAGQGSFESAFRQAFQEVFGSFDDQAAYAAAAWVKPASVDRMREELYGLLDQQRGNSQIEAARAAELLRRYGLMRGHEAMAPFSAALIAEDNAKRYLIDDVLVKTPDGATINAIIARPRRASSKLPTLLEFTIYTFPDIDSNAIRSASRGYAGVIGFTRGKRRSPDPVVPYEHDGDDARALIDWISRQPWSDGRVGMYGGSYNGFTQWAAVKRLHPALKTIVPYCPNDPGDGLPMTNNVFLSANYGWVFYAASGKYLDDQVYADPQRWNNLGHNWYRSGRPYREIDQVDGHPNPWLQRWLNHPEHDGYWQGMTANGRDYEKLDIPVLAIDGYFDDGQNNAVRRLQEHYRHRPDAEHYLVIGPYDHFGTQRPVKSPVLRGYAIDPVASLDTPNLAFQWFDHVFKGGAKPALLRDRINYQVMGANVWRHAPSIEAMSDQPLTLYLTDVREGGFYQMAEKAPAHAAAVKMTVDFADRTVTSANTYPSEIVTRDLGLSQGLAFISTPVDAPISVNGLFSATLRAIINKKDLDVAMALYEVMPSGEYFHLSYTVARASYAKDTTKRQLLTPHQVQTLKFDRTLLVSRQLSKGSRLLLVLDVNRGPVAQVNHGTGKDVSDESIADAGEPLQVEWLNDSYITVPISR